MRCFELEVHLLPSRAPTHFKSFFFFFLLIQTVSPPTGVAAAVDKEGKSTFNPNPNPAHLVSEQFSNVVGCQSSSGPPDIQPRACLCVCVKEAGTNRNIGPS